MIHSHIWERAMPQLERAVFSCIRCIRSYLWPIQSHEIKKLVPMVIVLALVVFDYSTLHNLKDALLITARGSGAEVIPFIKLWGMLPAAVLATMLFSFLLNRFSRAVVFQTVIISFALFFLLEFGQIAAQLTMPQALDGRPFV